MDTNNKGSDISHRRGVVLIDELDAHLHPSWQRKIVPLLRKTFPNVQLICTGHSPMIVGGCLEGEVSLLRAPSDGRIVVDQFEGDFIGWEPAEIYRHVFEIEERDEEYERLTTLLPKQQDMQVRQEELLSIENPSDAAREEFTGGDRDATLHGTRQETVRRHSGFSCPRGSERPAGPGEQDAEATTGFKCISQP